MHNEETAAGYFYIFRYDNYDAAVQATTICQQQKIAIEKLQRKGLSLEEIFVNITQNDDSA